MRQKPGFLGKPGFWRPESSHLQAPIYLDNNATTPMLPAVWDAMRPYALDAFGNPASAHAAGRLARRALEDARDSIASILDAHPEEVVFTSGATEANNLAVFGLAGDRPGRVFASPIEHPCVNEPLERLGPRGFAIQRLPVDSSGIVALDGIADLPRGDARLVAVMLANHETGAIQPVRRLAELFEAVPLHCDAAQAVGKIPVRFHEFGVATLSLSGHKFHGPKGIGALLVRRGTSLAPLLFGGPQQRSRRPGTEPVALAVGMAKALELWREEQEARTATVRALRHAFLSAVMASAQPVVENSSAHENLCLPHTLNLSFPGCPGDVLLMKLDLLGVACSTGSACSSGSLLPSPVLRAMGVPADVLRSALRFSFSHLLSESHVLLAAERLIDSVAQARNEGGL